METLSISNGVFAGTVHLRGTPQGVCILNAAAVFVGGDAADLLELAGTAAKKGNKNAVTDAAIGVMMARTAVLAALYNVKINLNFIKDPSFVGSISKEVNALEAKILQREKELLATIKL
jgi:formiminotetrahydrofolate cyclodeaminase